MNPEASAIIAYERLSHAARSMRGAHTDGDRITVLASARLAIGDLRRAIDDGYDVGDLIPALGRETVRLYWYLPDRDALHPVVVYARNRYERDLIAVCDVPPPEGEWDAWDGVDDNYEDLAEAAS